MARTYERLHIMNGEFYDELELSHYVLYLAKGPHYEVSKATGQRPIDLWEREKEYPQIFYFELLVEYSYDAIRRIVSTETVVQVRMCKYSVPIKYIGEEVKIRLTIVLIYIYYNGELDSNASE